MSTCDRLLAKICQRKCIMITTTAEGGASSPLHSRQAVPTIHSPKRVRISANLVRLKL